MIWGNIVVRRAVAPAALVAALLLLAFPSFAAAIQTYKVDNNGDGSTKALCEAHITNECTLRGALEAAEADPGFDLIEFSQPQFDGQVGESEITVGSPLPTITQPLTIFGHPVFGVISPTIASPSVGVTAPAGQPALQVASAGVTVESMAFGGGEVGIEVVAPTTGLNVRSSWFGLQVNGGANPIEAAGVILGATADEATIGGDDASERNIFAHAEVGIELRGASKTKITGNYLGVNPEGTGSTGLETGVRIEDRAAPAEDNEIGGVLGATEIATGECTGPCNAIATEIGNGIELAGSAADPQQAAHGPTAISGNFIGLKPDGTGPIGEGGYGVLAAPSLGCENGPSDVTVGGAAAGEGNFIAGGTFGIAAQSAENFKAIGNSIGITPDGSQVASPGASAITLCAESVTEPATISGNRMVLEPDTVGIESFHGQAQLVGNSIEGGFIGIETAEAGVGGGAIIQANTVTDSDRQGILLTDELNVVIGNTVSGSGWSGIDVEEGGQGNRIGGDQPGEANTVNGTGNGNNSGAILIEGTKASRNEVAANTGSGNFGSFIELVGHSSSETPNDIQPPALTAAYQSSATGTAAPNATVRVFSKASPAVGELGTLLAVAKADAAGAWTTTYATQPLGGLVAATQTSDAGTAIAGTSEVSAPTAAIADPPKPPEPEKGNSGGGGSTQTPTPSPPPPATKKAPKVKITSGPKKNGTATTAKFKFKAEPAAGAKFECKLDGAKWARCSSPKTYKKLKVGKHTFRVRATAGGLTGTVAVFKFTIKE